MLYISIVLGAGLLLAELICRKHAGKGSKRGLFHPTATVFFELSRKSFLYERFRAEIRRSGTMSERQTDEEAERQFIKICVKGLKGLLLLDVLVLIIALIPKTETDRNTLTRPGVGEESVNVSINLNKDGSEKTYSLELSPREYSSEEFKEMAGKAYSYLSDIIRGDNSDLENVMHDLVLPQTDETGTLRVEWYSDDSELIGIDGRVNSREIEEAQNVRVSAILTDGIHDRKYIWKVRVIPYVESDWAERIEAVLKTLEEGSREDESFVLPDTIEGVGISAEKESELSDACKILIFGFILIICYVILQFSRVRRKASERQDELLGRYSYFVSSIVLKVGSGLSVRETMISIYTELKDRGIRDGLYEELNYIVNGLQAGRDEKTVYLEMGRGSGVHEYSGLMTLITRNLERGNSNLLDLLRKEEEDAFNERKLRARRKGEEAAEKLLIPMFILLITVIGIVMFPALKNF